MKDKDCECKGRCWHHHFGCNAGGFYFLGFIGAAVYFLSSSVGFWPDTLAILKALVWPAFIVYDLFRYFGMQ